MTPNAAACPERERATTLHRMSLRRILFWLHFTLGSLIGVVVFFLAFTGLLMAFQPQVIAWVERGSVGAMPPETATRHLGEWMRQASAFEHSATPTTVTLFRDPGQPTEVGFGPGEIVLTDSGTGGVHRASRLRNFFATVTELHRWLALPGVWRDRARAVKAACCLVLLFQFIVGLVLWIPRKIGWQQFVPLCSFGQDFRNAPSNGTCTTSSASGSLCRFLRCWFAA
jgi:uncharacterized iron-regulated membrane protein